MKKWICLSLVFSLLAGLCACGQAQQPGNTPCGHEAYSGLIACLEAGDYDGARSLIDAMEGSTGEQTTQLLPAATGEMLQEETAAPDFSDCEAVELTEYNIKEYFEFAEEFYIGEQSWCTQYITLKEEYRNRLLSMQKVTVEVSYLRSDAYGRIDLEEEEFQAEYYDILSREKEIRTLELEEDGVGWITDMSQFSDRGYFPDYAMDVEIESGSGTLVLSVE